MNLIIRIYLDQHSNLFTGHKPTSEIFSHWIDAQTLQNGLGIRMNISSSEARSVKFFIHIGWHSSSQITHTGALQLHKLFQVADTTFYEIFYLKWMVSMPVCYWQIGVKYISLKKNRHFNFKNRNR